MFIRYFVALSTGISQRRRAEEVCNHRDARRGAY